MEQPVAKKREPYYPDRYMNCSEETLLEWKQGLEGEIGKFETEIDRRRAGIDQIDGELARRAAARKAKQA